MPKIRNETKIPALTTTQHCTEAKHQENWGVGGGRSGGEKEKSPDQKGKIKIMSICRQYDLVYRKPQGIHTHKLIRPNVGDQRGFPGGSDGKESACIAGDGGSIPGLG